MTQNQDIQISADGAEPEPEAEPGAEAAPAARTETEDAAQSEPEAEAVAGTEAGTGPGTEATDGPEPTRKKRISGGRLFTAALTIGVLGGVGAGYAVQASRPPTPLPSLAATQPKYAPAGVYQGIAAPQLPASQDDAARTEGNLAALLPPAPSGSSTEDSGWVDQNLGVVDDADLCANQSDCFTTDLNDGVDAVADTSWTTSSGFDVEIRLLRFAPGSSDQALSKVQDWTGGSGETVIPVPSGIEATGFEYFDSYDQNDDEALAVHGDIVAMFWVTSSTKMPNPSLIDGVIKQQMGRL